MKIEISNAVTKREKRRHGRRRAKARRQLEAKDKSKGAINLGALVWLRRLSLDRALRFE
jgi:hypothetical protein